jgi:hypothetical protein
MRLLLIILIVLLLVGVPKRLALRRPYAGGGVSLSFSFSSSWLQWTAFERGGAQLSAGAGELASCEWGWVRQ